MSSTICFINLCIMYEPNLKTLLILFLKKCPKKNSQSEPLKRNTDIWVASVISLVEGFSVDGVLIHTFRWGKKRTCITKK